MKKLKNAMKFSTVFCHQENGKKKENGGDKKSQIIQLLEWM